MAQLITVRLSRVDAQPWGLRLQGGKDFGTPLVVQKVNIGSIADQAGLIAGDSVIKVNNVDVFSLRHKDAQDIIVRSGNSFEITIQRGGSTWRPSVTPTGAIPSPTPSYGNQINTVTKTSLAHKQQESQHIGCGYNNAARPFQNGSEPVKSIVNKQYNTPVGIYSEESIAETLSAQAEVLAGGVLGVNFKKNEKVYNSAGSEVLKALQESENDPAEPDEFSPSQLRPVTPVTKHVHAPETRPAPPSTGGLPAGQNICAECERLIVGVFVRIKDKNLHVDCFKCATCGTSLKNQGYFNLNNKLYCDVHAKLAAVNNPPPGTEGYKPVPIGPNTKLSASTISAALSAHHGNLPHQNGTSHNNNLPSNLGSPKPYSYGSGPPPAGPKSPSSYPPPNWSQPKQQAYAPPQQTYAPPQQTYAPPQQTYAPPQQTYAPPQQTYAPPQQTYAPPKPTYAPPQNYSSPASNFNNNNFGSNTLPRSVGQSAPDESSNPPPPSQPLSSSYDTYEEDYVEEFSRPSTSAFSWPPPPDEDHDLPTASPLYIAPPETQHVQVKTMNNSDNVDTPPATWAAQQSRSAPQLTVHNLKEHNEAESCSESYTSTCTTTTTTSEEYQKMYRAHQAEFGCDQSVSDMDYHADAEMASMVQQYGSFSSASTDLISFAGRRSVQECTDALSNKVDTCQLIHYIRELEQSNQKPVKKVEFADPVHEAIDDEKKISKLEIFPQPESPKPLPPSNISNPVPKEWKSLMVQALTTAPSQPYHVSEIQIESCNLPCQQFGAQNEVCYKTCPGKDTCEKVSCNSIEFSKVESQESKATSTTLLHTEEQNSVTEITRNEIYDQNENNYLRLTDASCSNQKVEEAPFVKEEPRKGSLMSSVLTVASPYPVEWTKPFEDPIPLPEETVPYFPPPIDMTPYEKGDYGKKSPFIDALTTAPFRSYTPFEHDVITQLEDLPTPTQELSMIDALTVAPNDSYHELNQELPPVTAHEQIENNEKERLEKQAQEVSAIIAQTIESHMDKQISAFAKFTGFRSVHPFKPRQNSMPSVSIDTDAEVAEVSQSIGKTTCTYTSTSSAQNTVSFPPPPGVKCKSHVQSGLNIPKTIPKYQRQWFNLPSQSPVRTPEPQELKENVPLAFVDVPHEKTESVQKPVAVTVSSASTIEETKSSSFATQSQQYQSTVSTTIPTVQEPRRETVSVPSQSLESPDKREHQRAVSPYRAHTPSLINKPAPAIPYYQQNLVAEECSATSSLLFDPRTQSPRPDGCKSPAPGPPPNPLRIHAPRIKSPDPAEQYDTVTQTIDTGISNQFQAQSAGKLLSQHQTLNQSGMQSYVVKPEIVQQSQLGNLSIQSRSNQSELNEQKRSDFQNSSTTQIGNTQIQRNTRVVEEFEHSQKAKTVEVYKSTGRPPIRSITAEPTTPKTSCFLQKSGQTDLENAEEKISIKSSGPGFVAREARRLSTNSQYKADLAEYQSTFPQFSCETPPCAFPTKSFHPILEEPKFQTYNVNKRAGAPAPPPGYQQISKPILTKSTQHLSNKLAQITESSASSTLTSATTAMTQPVSSSTPYKPPIAIPVPAFKPPMTSANDFKPSQSAANNFKPTPSSGPGFKPPNTTIPSAVVSNPTPASAGPNKGLTFGATSAPKRGRGILSKGPGPGGRVPQCGCCNAQIRGPFITALGRIWCPDHFVCVSQSCRRPLADIGFVEEKGDLYCEYCFEKYLAPPCDKCGAKIKGDCLNAIGKHYHPECFVCTYCGKLFGNSPFFLEEGQAYCEADWNELFTTKCFACGFPVEAGDRWVEALSHNYHSQCFNCTMCKKNLEGQSFFAKGGRPYCKNHAR